MEKESSKFIGNGEMVADERLLGIYKYVSGK